jgi:lipopolysaccharide export system protein LptA
MLVKGNASLKMPSGELAGANLFRSAEATNKFVVRLSTNDLAEIFCEEYSLRPQNAEFRGGVYATHPRMNWVCETLSIKLSPSGGQMQNLLAEGGVSFQLAGEKGGQLEGTADKAVYTYGVERGATNDLLTLTGSPATLKTGDGTVLRNPVIILDRVHNQLRTPGDYTISGTAKLPNTNAFRLPKAQGGR